MLKKVKTKKGEDSARREISLSWPALYMYASCKCVFVGAGSELLSVDIWTVGDDMRKIVIYRLVSQDISS